MMCSKKSLFELYDLSVIFTVDNLPPNKILENIEQVFYKNSLYLISGSNGVGKTTLIKSILGRIDTSGYPNYIKHNNEYITAKKFIKKIKIGYIPQHPQEALVKSFSIGENIAFRHYIKNSNSVLKWLSSLVYSSKEKKKIIEFLKSYTFLSFLANRLDESIQNLSGGQQQLLNLAIVLYFKPDLVIMDEPTSKLDKEHKLEFWKQILDIHKNKNNEITYIITTHDKDLIHFEEEDEYEKFLITNARLIEEDEK